MALYYYIVNSLPLISLAQPPEISSVELKDQFRMNLNEKDWRKFEKFLLYIDLRNLKAFWLDKPLDIRGNLSEKELEEAILVPGVFPDYFYDFFDAYDSTEERLRHFPSLIFSFFQQEYEGYLKKFFSFEKDVRLILLAFRAKQWKFNVVKALQFENPDDPLVADILAQKDMDFYEPPLEYQELKEIYQKFKDDPQSLGKAILIYKLDKIEEFEKEKDFSVNQLLAYFTRLIFIEDWFFLNQKNTEDQILNQM